MGQMGHSGDFARWPHLGPIPPMDGGGAGRRPARQCDDPPTTARILGTGPKLSHIRTYRAHLDRGSGGQAEQDSSPAVIALQPTVGNCEERRRSIQCRTRQPEVHREAWNDPALVSSLARSGCPFHVGDRACLGCRESRSPIPRGGGARLRGSERD